MKLPPFRYSSTLAVIISCAVFISGSIIFVRARATASSDIDTARLQSKIDNYFQAHPAEHGVYVEYLPSGQSVSIAADRPFLASSLLKLPYVMDMYRADELQRLKLDRQVDITPEMRDARFGDMANSGLTQVSLRQAARAALTNSDNTALNVIKYYTGKYLDPTEQSLSRLHIALQIQAGMAYIDAKSYAGILKCIYAACYNSPSHATEMLEYLSASQFAGIADGVPESIRVAHKIGTAPQTHNDCGIIFAPHRPYILCVMLDQPRDTYVQTMKDVSQIVYDEIISAP